MEEEVLTRPVRSRPFPSLVTAVAVTVVFELLLVTAVAVVVVLIVLVLVVTAVAMTVVMVVLAVRAHLTSCHCRVCKSLSRHPVQAEYTHNSIFVRAIEATKKI